IFLLVWWRQGRERAERILAKSAVVGAVLVLAGFAPFYSGAQTFSIIAFGTNPLAYTNSPLELAFRQLRVALGDPESVATLPLHYQGFWVGVDQSTILWDVPDPSHGRGVALPEDEPLLVVEPPGGEWLHVYEPRLGRFGYVQYHQTHTISAPRLSQTTELTAVVLHGATQDPSAKRSNLILRVLTFIAFLPLYLWVGLRARDNRSLFRASLAVLMLFLVVVQGWFWPWYLIWALPFAAFEPESLAADGLLVLSASTSVLNAQPNVNPSPVVEWIYELRVVAIDGLPLVLGLIYWWRHGRRYAPTPALPVHGEGADPTSALPTGGEGVRFPPWTGGSRGGRPGEGHGWFSLDPQWSPAALTKAAWQRNSRASTLFTRRYARAFGAALLLAGGLTAFAATSAPAASAPPPPVIGWQRSFADAQRSFSARDYSAAVSSLNDVLAEQPSDGAAIRLRLASYLQMQRYAEAIPDATVLLEADPSNVDLHLERGTLYLHVQRADLAMADFEAAMALAPNSPSGFEGAGNAAFQAGDLDFASDMLWQAHSLAPQDGKISQELADVLATKGDFALALRLADDSVQRLPGDATVYADRAALRRFAGLDESSVPDLQKVLTLSGDLQQHQWAEQLIENLTNQPTKSAAVR
ncbi:MAG TPA: tetratricopeptide repeat protein, partial [Chloroflexota bacterium]|nr:tetratricopeptide repeat protein [Chloroflexota bacterium]